MDRHAAKLMGEDGVDDNPVLFEPAEGHRHEAGAFPVLRVQLGPGHHPEDRMTAVLEPVLILLMVGIVLMITLAVLQPIMQATQGIAS